MGMVDLRGDLMGDNDGVLRIRFGQSKIGYRFHIGVKEVHIDVGASFRITGSIDVQYLTDFVDKWKHAQQPGQVVSFKLVL